MNRTITITVEFDGQTSTREFDFATVLEEGTDLNEVAHEILDDIKNIKNF